MLYNPEEVVRIARLYEVIRKQEQQINTETDPVGLKVLAKDLLTNIGNYRDKIPYEIREALQKGALAPKLGSLEERCRQILESK